jgi:DNA ligase (NAD+)
MAEDAARRIQELRSAIARADYLTMWRIPELQDDAYDALLRELQQLEARHPDLITPIRLLKELVERHGRDSPR